MKKLTRTLTIFILILQLSGSYCWPSAMEGSMVAGFLFEIGMDYYNQGKYFDALHEFKKTLLIQPKHEGALQYIQLIQESRLLLKEKATPLTKIHRGKIIQLTLDGWEGEYEIPVEVVEVKEAALMPEKIAAPSPRTVGEIRLFINNTEAGLEEPILIKDGMVFVPLRDIAKGLHFSVLDLGEGKFRLISPEGLSQEIEVSLIEGIPMINQEALDTYFSVESSYDASKKRLFVTSDYLPEFETYLVESIKPLPTEARIEEEYIEEDEGLIPPEYIPKAAQPSVDLHGSLAYMYRDYHLQSTYHSQSASLRGRFYDYDLSYETLWKDIAGEFQQDYTYLNFHKENLWVGLFDQSVNLNPLRNQSRSFNGLKVINSWGENSKTTVYGGGMDNYIFGAGGSVKYIGNIYGIDQEYKPLDWWSLRGALLYTDNTETQPSSLSGTTSFPRNNLVYLMDNSVRLIDNFSVFTQLAQCNYYPDDNPDASMDDLDWRVGTEWLYPKGRTRFAYEFVGDEYASVGNPLSYQDYKGWELYSDYLVTQRWRLSGGLRGYENNVDGDSDRVTTENKAFSISSSHKIFNDQSLSLGFDRFISKPTGPGAGSSSRTNIHRVDYFRPFIFDTRLFMNYQYSVMETNDGGDYYSHSPGISLFRSFGRGSSWYFRQDFLKTLYRDSENTLDSSSTFNLSYEINPELRLDFDSTFSYNRTKGYEATENISGGLNLTYQLNPKTSLNFEYAVNSYNPDIEKEWPKNWSVMFYVRQDFDIQSPPNFGRLIGAVILDSNTNGIYDFDEMGIEGAVLQLEDGRKTRTDAEGYFVFDYVTPGIQKVSLDLADLPLEWTTEELDKEVEIRPLEDAHIYYPLIESASIQGKVFIDSNDDWIFQENEEPVDGVAILLLPQEQFRTTDEEGNFRFDYLMPGSYAIKIYSDSLPEGFEVVSTRQRDVELTSGQEVSGLNFILRWGSPTQKF